MSPREAGITSVKPEDVFQMFLNLRLINELGEGLR